MSPVAGIVLAGGRSRRMGAPKAALEWHGSTLLRRVAGIVGRAVDGPVIVVRAPGQDLPDLPPQFEIAEDEHDGLGPLQGMVAGFAAIGERARVAFVSCVDAPLLHPALVAHVVAALQPGDDVAVPRAHGYAHPLAAAYRTSLAARLAPLIEAGLGTRPLFERCAVRELDAGLLLADPALRELDPLLDSLLNLNEPGEYAAARARPAPRVSVLRAGARAPIAVRAATFAAALVAAGEAGGGPALATLNGERAIADPEDPLVAGDLLVLECRHRLRGGEDRPA